MTHVKEKEQITNASLISLITGSFCIGVSLSIIAYWLDEGQGKTALALIAFICLMLTLNVLTTTFSALKISRAIKHYNSEEG